MKEKVLAYISANPGCNSLEISQHIGASQPRVVERIRQLRDAGQVVVHGTGKAICYALPGVSVAARSIVGAALELIQQAGSKGISRQELMRKLNVGKTAVDDRIKELRGQKKILPANGKLPGALYYAAGVIPEEKPKPVFVKPVPKPAPLPKLKVTRVIEKRVIPEVIVPDNVKITRIETLGYDPRFQVPQDTRVVGGFASMGIGRYL